jgi:hypothetical protein
MKIMKQLRNFTSQAKIRNFNRGIAAFISLVILLGASPDLQHATAQNVEPTVKLANDMIYVVPPRSERETNQASIQTALTSVEQEARRFMAGYANDLLSQNPDAIAARYSQRGTFKVFPGDWNLQPHDSITRMYREEWQGPEAFGWHDLSYEVLGDDAVAVIGGFRFETGDNSGALGTYTAILMREDGQLRIRLENESFDNLPPKECEALEEPCDLPLDHAALERYAGEYEVPGQETSARVYEEDGSLVIHSPGFPPRRLLYRGGDEFRLADYPVIRLVFNGAGEKATSYIAFSGMVMGTGKRVTAPINPDGR